MLPIWFDLSKYHDLHTYTAHEWLVEISSRYRNIEVLGSPTSAFHPPDKEVGTKNDAREMLLKLKAEPLYARSREKSEQRTRLDEMWKEIRGGRPEPLATPSICDLSSFNAYAFLADAEDSDRITSLFKRFRDQSGLHADEGPKAVATRMNERLSIVESLGQPLYKDANWSPDAADQVLNIQVSYEATDEQLMRDFRVWLDGVRAAGFTSFAASAFSDSDFQKWIDKRLLPYFDLVTISELENETITQNVVGQALFPDDIDVDTTERVRKVVKPLARRIFSESFIAAFSLHCGQPEW